MAKEYQGKKGNPYILPHNVYMCTLYMIKDYDRLKDEYHDEPSISAHTPSEKISGNDVGNPTEKEAIRRRQIEEKLHAIDQALFTIPEEYRRGEKQNAMYGAWLPIYAGERTYRRWKQRFIYEVAKNLNFL